MIRANHIGDWGAQFGMLIAYLEKMASDGTPPTWSCAIWRPSTRPSVTTTKAKPSPSARATYVVKLQGGDEYCRTMWKKLVDMTMEQNQRNYDRLNVSLTNKGHHGRSMYNDMLPEIVADLKAKGLAVERRRHRRLPGRVQNRMASPWGHHPEERRRLSTPPPTSPVPGTVTDPGRRPGHVLHRLPSAPAPDAGLDHHPQGGLYCRSPFPSSTTPSA